MQAIFSKYRFLLAYLFWPVAAFVLYLAGFIFPHQFWGYFLFVIGLAIFLPGFLIWHLLRVSTSGFFRLLVMFSLGIFFYLLVNIFGIFLALNLSQLIIATQILLGLLFIAALILDFIKPFPVEPIFNRNLFTKKNIIYLLPALIVLLIFVVLIYKGADFNGDPYYHLAIIQKITSGSSLSPANLVFSLTGSSNPAYAYPAWHIFIAEVSRLLNLDIFTVWSGMILPLYILAVISWYLLAKTIFVKKTETVIAFILFLGFTFFGQAGYLFQRLTVPDTLAQYLLMPIALTLFLVMIQKREGFSFRLALVYMAVLVSLLLVHGIHYFYVFFAVLMFTVLSLIWHRQDWKKTLAGLAATAFPLLAVLILLEFKAGFVSDTLHHFNGSEKIDIAYASFKNIPLTFKYAFLLSPLLLLFTKQRKGMLLLFSLAALVPLIYWTPLKTVTARLLSFVFTDRLMGNVALYYFIFAALLASFLLGFQRLIASLPLKEKKTVFYLLAIVLFLILTLEGLYRSVSRFFEAVFYSESVSNFLDQYGLVVLGAVVLLGIGIFVWHQRQKVNPDKVQLPESAFVSIFFCLILAVFLFSPSATRAFEEVIISKGENITPLGHLFNTDDLGDGWHYLSDRPKSVVLADDEGTKELSVLVNHHMAFSLASSAEEELMKTFYQDTSDEQKLELVLSPAYGIDYIYLRPAYADLSVFFDRYPDKFQKVHDGSAKIYEVKDEN